MTVYGYSDDSNKGKYYGEFKSKTEFIELLAPLIGLCLDEKEHRKDASWIKENSTETGNELGCIMAQCNRNRIVFIPTKITYIPFWEEQFRGKFFFEDTIKNQKEIESIVERNEKLETCISNITTQIEMIGDKK